MGYTSQVYAMQGLKALVIFMGVLIVVGTTALVVLIVKKYNNLGEEDGNQSSAVIDAEEEVDASVPAGPATVAGQVFGDVSYDLPPGSSVKSLQTSGQILIVQYAHGQGTGILLISLNTGQKLGNVDLKTASGN